MTDPNTPGTPDPEAPQPTSPEPTAPEPAAPQPVAPEPLQETPVDAPAAPPVGEPTNPYAAPANPYAQPAGVSPEPAAYAAYSAAPTASKTPLLSILSLVAGGLSFLGGAIVFIPFVGSILALPFPIAAIILGFLGKKKEPNAAKGLWLTGIILGFVGVAVALIGLVLWIVVAAASPSYDY